MSDYELLMAEWRKTLEEFDREVEKSSKELKNNLDKLYNEMHGQQNSVAVAAHLSMFHGYKESSDAKILAKELVQDTLWLFFGVADNNGGPYFGFLIGGDVFNDTARQKMRAILGLFDKNSGEILEKRTVIYRTWINTGAINESKMIINTMKELELQTRKVLYG